MFKPKTTLWFEATLWVAAAVFGVVFPAFALIILVPAAIVFLVWQLSRHLEWGWYGLVFLSPFTGWELSFNWLKTSVPSLPWLYTAHAPMVEFWTLLLLVAFLVRIVQEKKRGTVFEWYWPALEWFALFAFSAILSLINLVPSEQVFGIKYFIHFILLFYVGYIMLGANIVDSKTIWRRSLKVLASVGLIGAVMGIFSIIINIISGNGFKYATPISLWGFAPMGTNHILLAEVLTTALPLYLYFWYTAETPRAKKYYAVTGWLVAVVGLLTLSRAGWITIGVEAILFYILTKDKISWLTVFLTWGRVVALSLVPVAGYLGYFLLHNPFAKSSISARWRLTEIAYYLFREHPFIGQGVGSFVTRLSEIMVFKIQFGEALDAHGIAQKLLSEQGLFGLVTFSLFLGVIIFTVFRRARDSAYTAEARAAYFVSLFLVMSPVIFQVFNTQYYSSKMWVPIALAVSQSILYKLDTNWFKLQINLKSQRVITEL